MNNLLKFFIGINIFWLVIIAFMIIPKEFAITSGTSVTFKVAPVDPRDIFRGDYVVLSYDNLSNLDKKLQLIDNASFFKQGKTVYVRLIKEGNYYKANAISPFVYEEKDLFIKGKINYVRANSYIIDYGIENFFVPEDTGRDIERINRRNQDLAVKVSIDSSGNSVLTDIIINGKVVNLRELIK